MPFKDKDQRKKYNAKKYQERANPSLLHDNSTMLTEGVITKRMYSHYDPVQQNIIQLQKQNILNEMTILKLTNELVIFKNQEIIGHNVVTAFKNRNIINIMVVAKTQSGKTGSMCATIKQYLEDRNNLIPTQNIYIITGLSSCEWKEQTKERMPKSIQDRVFHRCELPSTFVDEIKDKTNVLIIMDEIQVAAKKGQTIYKAFNNAGLLNKQNLYENDVKILEYTATPDGTIYDLMKWADASAKILADVGDGYVSSFDLLESGRVHQYKELCCNNKNNGIGSDAVLTNIREILSCVETFSTPRYHIIRTKNGIDQDSTILNFKHIFDDRDKYAFVNFDKDSEMNDINNTLNDQPSRHTFIFIKEMLRCAKTLNKTFIGILYDRHCKNPDDATVIQGLVGRDTGYDNNGTSICYTNVDSIVRYEKLWESQFENKTIRWNSKTTKFKNGLLSGHGTFNDPKNYDPLPNEIDSDKPLTHIFKTQKEVKEYYNRELKPKLGGRGPNHINPNNLGYYESTLRSKKKIYSCEEIVVESNKK